MHVNTVLGPVSPDQLGLTLVHEHLLLGWPGADLDPTSVLRRDAAVATCTAAVRELHSQGVQTIVDPCPIDLGRDPEIAAEVSSATGVHIVVATGLYEEEVGFPHYFRERSVEELTDIFVAELTQGIGNSGIRAGILKVASGPAQADAQRPHRIRMGRHEERAHRAAARATLATGAPIMAHNSERSPAGVLQVQLFVDEGVPLERVIVGHAGGVGDLAYYSRVLQAGASLGFDRFGVESLCPDSMRIASLVGLAKTGHLEQLFISTDAAMCWRGRPSPLLEENVRPKSPNWESRHLLARVVPQLRRAGLSESDVRTILVDNPRRWFGG